MERTVKNYFRLPERPFPHPSFQHYFFDSFGEKAINSRTLRARASSPIPSMKCVPRNASSGKGED